MKKILAFIEEKYEDLELWYPKIRLKEAGHQFVVAAPKEGHVYQGKHGYPCKAERAIEQIHSKEWDALLIPGGFAPDKLRVLPKVLAVVQEMHETGKVIAPICHGGWVCISAKILKGKRVTSCYAIKDDMENAGAIWLDEATVVDQNLISARTPDDLHLFVKAMLGRI